jgi:hypothetical protein
MVYFKDFLQKGGECYNVHAIRDHLQIIRSKSEMKRNGFPFLPDFKIGS